MARYIDAEALLSGYDVRKVTEYDESGCGIDYKAVPVEAIETAPTIDAVEVVRCKDCTNFGPSPFGYSPTVGWCKLEGCHHKLDYYCASGERREDG